MKEFNRTVTTVYTQSFHSTTLAVPIEQVDPKTYVDLETGIKKGCDVKRGDSVTVFGVNDLEKDGISKRNALTIIAQACLDCHFTDRCRIVNLKRLTKELRK